MHNIVTSYSRIRQPESWAQWFIKKIDDVEYGKITNPQDFVNQFSIKLFIICNTDTGFQSSYQIITKEILAVMAEKKHKPKPDSNILTYDDSDPDTK